MRKAGCPAAIQETPKKPDARLIKPSASSRFTGVWRAVDPGRRTRLGWIHHRPGCRSPATPATAYARDRQFLDQKALVTPGRLAQLCPIGSFCGPAGRACPIASWSRQGVRTLRWDVPAERRAWDRQNTPCRADRRGGGRAWRRHLLGLCHSSRGGAAVLAVAADPAFPTSRPAVRLPGPFVARAVLA